MHRTIGDEAETGEIAIVVEHHMQLDRALGAAKRRPVLHRQTQIDRGRIETDQLVLETKRAFVMRLSGDRRKQAVEDLFEQLPRTVAVRVRQRGADWGCDPQVDQLALATLQPALDLPQRMGPTELAKQHPHKLAPARQTLAAIFGPRSLDDALEVRARDELKYLAEHAA